MHGNRTTVSHTDQSTQPPTVYQFYHDPASAANLSTTVVHALADCMGMDVTDVGFSLYDSVDPDALDALFAPKHDGTARPGGSVTFHVWNYRVTIHGDGRIFVEPPARGYDYW